MRIIFFEKPGCIGNAKQKAILTVAGHELETKNLLTYPFTREELLSYFGTTQVADWFNRNAPSVKSKEVNPDTMDRESALDRMLREPILIRRPLMDIGGKRCAGFDLNFIEAVAGPLPQNERLDAIRHEDLEQCAGATSGYRCPNANAASAVESAKDKSEARARSQPDQT
jgi:nitrogenase-associated protein